MYTTIVADLIIAWQEATHKLENLLQEKRQLEETLELLEPLKNVVES